MVDRQHGRVVGEAEHEAAMDQAARIRGHLGHGGESHAGRAFAQLERLAAQPAVDGGVGVGLHEVTSRP
jgi:hypothetical protein